MTRKTITFDSFIRGGIGIVIVLALLMLLKRLSGVLLPFFIAWLIAYLVYPLVTFIQYRLKLKNRMASIVAAFTVLLAIGVGAFYLVVPPFVAECSRVSQLISEYFAGRAAHSNIPQVVSEFLREHVDFHFLRQLLEGGDLVGAIKQAVPQLWSIIAESFNFLFGIFTFFIILLYVVFILLDYESISEGWIRLVPAEVSCVGHHYSQ